MSKATFAQSRNATLKRIYKQRHALIMLAPSLILIFIFCYFPLSGWYIAFSDFKVGAGMFSGAFVGLDNFIKLFADSSDYAYLIRNTLVMNGLTIVINLPLAGVIAVLLKEFVWKKGSKIVQAVSFFPYFISWVITYSLLLSLFSVNTGAVNLFLMDLGVIKQGINLMGLPRYSWGLIVAMDAWKFTGYNCIIFLATISGISLEEYEAAELDGANRFQKVIHITVPHMIPTMCVLLILNSGYILSSNLEQFFIFTNGTNWETMEVLDMYIYKFGLKFLRFSYATAVGIVKSVISIGMIVVVNLIVKKLNQTSIF